MDMLFAPVYQHTSVNLQLAVPNVLSILNVLKTSLVISASVQIPALALAALMPDARLLIITLFALAHQVTPVIHSPDAHL